MVVVECGEEEEELLGMGRDVVLPQFYSAY